MALIGLNCSASASKVVALGNTIGGIGSRIISGLTTSGVGTLVLTAAGTHGSGTTISGGTPC